ncbi:MAG TPA: hypothetical protein VHY32_10675 [Caulobacteraceae bacterium]|jgi:hypothetical protein|nr:hypothetical protein [Caulobacteraceae bacterium]
MNLIDPLFHGFGSRRLDARKPTVLASAPTLHAPPWHDDVFWNSTVFVMPGDAPLAHVEARPMHPNQG